MSTATLTPAEQGEVTRFGIHDEDALRDIVEHADDEPGCVFLRHGQACGATCTHRARCSACGGFLGTICAPHAHATLQSHHRVRHSRCLASGPTCELIEVTPL